MRTSGSRQRRALGRRDGTPKHVSDRAAGTKWPALARIQRHAVGTPVVQNLAVLQRRADGWSTTAAHVLQRESNYDGIVPDHATYGDSYQMGDGTRSSDFTYHHIIPENILKQVKKEFDAIKLHADRAAHGPAMNEFDQAETALLTGARADWMETRIKNTTHAINTTFSTFDISVTETEVRQRMQGQPDTMAHLFPAFRALLKEKVEARFNAVDVRCEPDLYAALGTPEVRARIRENPEVGIEALLRDNLDYRFFNIPTMLTAGMAGVNAEDPKIHHNVSTGTLRRKLLPRLLSARHSFGTFYATFCLPMHQDSTAEGNLKRVIQEKSLPHTDEHLKFAVQWNPGNVHRGPKSSSRISEGNEGFEELFDDGGDKFEKAAVNVLATDHYVALHNLNAAIETFIAPPPTSAARPPNGEKIMAAKDILQSMSQVQQMGLTSFKEAEWEPHGSMMRLKENVERVHEAEHRTGVTFNRGG